MRTRGIPPLAKPEISRFPCKELPHMPGSWTTPGRAAARAIASVRVAFRTFEHVGTQVAQVFAAQWLAYVLPYRRFADTLASANARLRAGADRYSFTVVDFHLLLFAGLPGAPEDRVDWVCVGEAVVPPPPPSGLCGVGRRRLLAQVSRRVFAKARA